MKWILCIFATLLAVFASIYWAVAFWPLSVLSSTHETEKEIIERTVSFYLINPDWIKVEGYRNILGTWIYTEAKARLTTVFILWIGTLTTILIIAKKGANKTARVDLGKDYEHSIFKSLF